MCGNKIQYNKIKKCNCYKQEHIVQIHKQILLMNHRALQKNKETTGFKKKLQLDCIKRVYATLDLDEQMLAGPTCL